MKKIFLIITILLSTLLFNFIICQSNVDTNSFNHHFKQLEVNDNSIVMLGEHHYNINFSEVELLTIKKLSKKGFNTLYIEGGTSESAIYNEYFKSENLEIIKNSRARRPEFLKFLNELKQINPNLIFKGFDFDRPLAVYGIFAFWFKGKNIQGIDLQKQINMLSQLKSNSLNKVKKNQIKLRAILDEFKNSLEENKKEYENILGNNLPDFKRILNNPVEPNFDTRDRSFADLILKEEQKEGLSKSIFIMGGDHMTLKNSFVPLLLEKLPTKYNVSCIALVTNNAFDQLRPTFYNMAEKKRVNVFETPKEKVIPSDFKNLKVIITMFYNFNKKGLTISKH